MFNVSDRIERKSAKFQKLHSI